MKVCLTCKYHQVFGPQHNCTHPLAVSPVTGEGEISCSLMRGPHGACGPEGRLHEIESNFPVTEKPKWCSTEFVVGEEGDH